MSNLFDELYQESLDRAEHKVWILSDLQQGLPENTRRCLAAGISDFELLGRPAEQIWYLGDAVEGAESDRLMAMCRLQEEPLLRSGFRFVMLPVTTIMIIPAPIGIRHPGCRLMKWYGTIPAGKPRRTAKISISARKSGSIRCIFFATIFPKPTNGALPIPASRGVRRNILMLTMPRRRFAHKWLQKLSR